MAAIVSAIRKRHGSQPQKIRPPRNWLQREDRRERRIVDPRLPRARRLTERRQARDRSAGRASKRFHTRPIRARRGDAALSRRMDGGVRDRR